MKKNVKNIIILALSLLVILLIALTLMISFKAKVSDYVTFFGSILSSIIVIPMTALISIYISGNEIRKNHKSDLDNTVFWESHETFEKVKQQCRWYYNKFGMNISKLSIISKIILSKKDSKSSNYSSKIKNEFDIISDEIGNLMFNGVYKINSKVLKQYDNTDIKTLVSVCQNVQNIISNFDATIELNEDNEISNKYYLDTISNIIKELKSLSQLTINVEKIVNIIEEESRKSMVNLILYGDQ